MGAETEKKSKPARRSRSFPLSQSQIRKFLSELENSGRAEGTIKKYRADLNRYYDFLGQEHLVTPESLPQWKASMVEAGYAPRTINGSMVAVNTLYNHLGRRDLQFFDWMELPESEAMELTREDYQTLLQEAKRQENIKVYLLVKILAVTDLTPGDMPLLTREAVNEGIVQGKKRGATGDVILPPFLREDLLDYAMQRGIKSGPIFRGTNRACLDRSFIGRMVANLGEDAGLLPGQATPRNLRRLHLSTLSEFQKKADDWVAMTYQNLLQTEETQSGWRIWLSARKESIHANR